MSEDYAFKFKCENCGKELKDGEELIIMSEGFMSGNTVVITSYKYTHKKCPEIGIMAFYCPSVWRLT